MVGTEGGTVTVWKVASLALGVGGFSAGNRQVVGLAAHSELGSGPSTPFCSLTPVHGLLTQTLLSGMWAPQR